MVAGAVAVVPGWTAGAAAAKPRPPVLAFTPSSYSYGQVAAGGAASQTFTLANTGGQATGKLRVTLNGAAVFTITGDTCKSLGPGKKCTVTVRFAPAGAGPVTATLTAAGKKRGATATVALTGTGALGAAPGHLYWATDSTINEANLDGSSPRVLVSGQKGAEALAVDASHLYWTNTVMARSARPTWTAAIRTSSSADVLSHGVAVDASHLYWTAVGEGAIYEANLDGTDPQALVSDQAARGGWRSTPATCSGPTLATGRSGGPTGRQHPHFILSAKTSRPGCDGRALAASVLGQHRGGTHGTINSSTLAARRPVHRHRPKRPGRGGGQYHSVYWSNPFGETVNQANLDGSNPHALFTDQFDPYEVAVGP